MQISRDGEMAGELIIWDFNYPDAESNENCGVVKKKFPPLKQNTRTLKSAASDCQKSDN